MLKLRKDRPWLAGEASAAKAVIMSLRQALKEYTDIDICLCSDTKCKKCVALEVSEYADKFLESH